MMFSLLFAPISFILLLWAHHRKQCRARNVT